MQQNNPLTIGIIGGGFCGVMTLNHLIKEAKQPLIIFLFNKKYPVAKGIAFQSYTDEHLMNVEARNMSAFVNDPDHFVKWCQRKQLHRDHQEVPTSYLPRNYYGQYLNEVYQVCLSHLPEHIQFTSIDDEVIDVENKGDQYIISTKGEQKTIADKIVLATGNDAPEDPKIPNTDFLKSSRYHSNPWNAISIQDVPEAKNVLIIGTGLTMVDVVLGLLEKNFTGKIIALSPHGFKILPHRKQHPQRLILDELAPPYDLQTVFKLFYKFVRQAKINGQSGETVVDAVRSKTQEIWQHLSLRDKERFMTHLRHMWGVARHRLPADIHKKIQSLIQDQHLEVVAGKIDNITVDADGAHVEVTLRHTHQKLNLIVDRVINCTGPQTDIRKQKGNLYRNLIEKKLVASDEMNLGIHATADGRIINSDGTISNRIFTLGSLLKGKLWESTAIPELRVQAYRTALLLLEEVNITNPTTLVNG